MRDASKSPTHPPTSVTKVDPSRWLENHGDALYNFAFNRLQNHDLAEEAVQETLVAGIRAVNEFRGNASEKTWLFAILRNKISDLLRSNWRTRSKVSLDDEANAETLLFDQNGNWRADAFREGRCKLESQELHEIVMQCIRKLPRNQATIFVLRVLQEKNSAEICQDLEISATNYWARLHRARLAIANCVARRWPLEN